MGWGRYAEMKDDRAEAEVVSDEAWWVSCAGCEGNVGSETVRWA